MVVADNLPVYGQCSLCKKKVKLFDMFKRGRYVFCSPKHAVQGLSWASGGAELAAVSKPAADEDILKILADLAASQVIRTLNLHRPEGRTSPPPPVLTQGQQLTAPQYQALLVLFERNKLFLEQEFAERLRAEVEKRLEKYSPENLAITVVGPLETAEEKDRYFPAFRARGPADYFIVKFGRRVRAAFIVMLDKFSPVLSLKVGP